MEDYSSGVSIENRPRTRGSFCSRERIGAADVPVCAHRGRQRPTTSKIVVRKPLSALCARGCVVRNRARYRLAGRTLDPEMPDAWTGTTTSDSDGPRERERGFGQAFCREERRRWDECDCAGRTRRRVRHCALGNGLAPGGVSHVTTL